jgi:hypothetical protein
MMETDMISEEFPADRMVTKRAMHYCLSEGHEVVRGTSSAGKEKKFKNDPRRSLDHD